MKKKLLTSFVIGCIAFFTMHLTINAKDLTQQASNEILFISSYNSDSHYVLEKINTFKNTYKNNNGKCNLVISSLNCLTLNEADEWMNRMRTIIKKHRYPKLIVLLGPEAVITFLSLKGNYLKKIPIYCIMCPHQLGTLPPKTGISSVASDTIKSLNTIQLLKNYNLRHLQTNNYSFKKTVLLIQRLFPATKEIAIISDNSYLRYSHKIEIMSQTHLFPQYKYTYIDGQKMLLKDAIQRYSLLPKKTSVILAGWRNGVNGSLYLDNASYAFEISNPRLPVFSFTGTSIGSWSIGGYISNYPTITRRLGNRAVKEVDKEMPITPYIKPLKMIYKFDSDVLKKFHINQNKLPQNTIIINKEKTLIDVIHRYWGEIIISLLLLALLIVSLVHALFANQKLKVVRQRLEKSEKRLKKEKHDLIRSEHQLRIAKVEAERANKMKSTFVSNMSHEIRTPLNAIVGFSNVIVDEAKGKIEGIEEYVELINKNSDLLLQLINDILDLSRMDAGRMLFNFETTDLNQISQHIIASFQTKNHKNITLKFSSQSRKIAIETDTIRLQQVLINLISNATKFTSEGSIHLHTEIKDTNYAYIYIEDTGKGIPIENQASIFTRFEKINEFTQGTGLGLSICQEIIKIMRGKIWIDSTYTKGAKFCILLPLKQKEKTKS